jgi:hypothetical protein
MGKIPNARERCAFPWARKRLSDEVDRLGATDAILSSNCVLNLSGEPRGDRQPTDTGVALYFSLKGRPMVMATDYYSEVASNLRRLSLALAYLRGLERHGGATMMERAFTGFAALPDPNRVKTWRDVLCIDPATAATADLVEDRFREQARKHHPDVGGTDTAMAEVIAAREAALRELGAA